MSRTEGRKAGGTESMRGRERSHSHWLTSKTRSALLVLGTIVLIVVTTGHASEDRDQAEAKLQQKQAAMDLLRLWRFDGDMKGRVPHGFSEQTVGEGPAGAWRVRGQEDAPSAPHVLVQTAPCETEGCFQLLLADDLTYDYVDLVFRLRSQTGNSSGIGGAVFGVRDARNFYAVLVDLSKDTLSVIRVLEGQETVLDSASITRKNPSWHHVRIQRNTIISKEVIETFFDNKLAVSVHDGTFRRGQVGLVTRGTVPMEFDNVHSIRIYSQRPLSGPAAY